MSQLLRDLRYGLRVIRNAPGQSVVVALAIAIGIGANAAVFSVVNATLLKPLPYADAPRLVMLWESNPKLQLALDNIPVTAPNGIAWREQSSALDELCLFRRSSFTVTGHGQPERVDGVSVEPALFSLLGVRPQLGRTLLPGDDQPGKDAVIVIGHGFWQRYLGGAPDVLGKTLIVDGLSSTIVGVMPPAFTFPREIESYSPQPPALWKPLVLGPAERNSRNAHLYRAVGRLAPDRTVEQASAEMDGIARELARAYPGSNAGFGVIVTPLHQQMVGDIRAALLVLLGAAAFVLLIACTNVANLLLGRTFERHKEIAVRKALGVSRWALIQQLLVESSLLGLIGCGFGLLFAFGATRLLRTLGPLNIPRLDEIVIDVRVVGFCVALSLLAALMFGLAPGIVGSRSSVSEAIREGARNSSASSRRRRSHSVLVIAELALALVLVIGANLLIRSFARILSVNPGFDAGQVLTMQLDLPASRYRQERQMATFAEQLLKTLEGLPGVSASGVISNIPLGASPAQANFNVEGRPGQDAANRLFADRISVSEGGLRALGIPLRQGRLFHAADVPGAPPVVVINETLARRFFAETDPVGKRLTFGDVDETSTWLSVVGVVADARFQSLDASPRPQVYVPFAQAPRARMTMVIRTTTDPLLQVQPARDAVSAIDRALAVSQVKTMKDVVSESVAPRRFNVVMLGLFAMMGLILAASGTYAVVSRSVTQRTSEFGIRIAVGAAPADIVKGVIREVIPLALIALAIGVPASWMLARALSSMLFQISPLDSWTLLSTVVTLTIVALLACYLPARRAAALDPVVALRSS